MQYQEASLEPEDDEAFETEQAEAGEYEETGGNEE